jgi:hypothetical protein
VSQLPSLILTLGYDPTQAILKVAPVKNRFGAHTADGSKYAQLLVNYAAVQIADQNEFGWMLRRDAMTGYQGGINV